MGALFILLALSLSACGDDVSPMDTGRDARDGAADSALDADATAPFTLAAPAPPQLTPCPAGWRETSEGGPAICEPYPMGLEDCPLPEAHFPGGDGCVSVTSACPSDGWPTDVPETAVVFLRADADPGGDGSQDAPFRTLAEAVAATPDGGAVAIAPGAYEATLIDRDVSLRGACAEVVLSGTDREPALSFENTHAIVDNLRITSAGTGLNAIASTLEVHRVVFDDIGGTGLSTTGGTTQVSRLRLHDVAGTAFYVAPSAVLMGNEVACTGAVHTALSSAGTIELADIVVATRSDDPEVFVGNTGSNTTLERLAVVGDGTMLALLGSVLTLRDAAIEGSPRSSTMLSGALLAFNGSEITLERTSHRRIWSFAMAAADPGSTLHATDVIIRAEAPGAVHDGIEIGQGATAVLTRVRLEGVRTAAVLATDEGSSVTAEDLVVRDTQPDATGVYGRALQIQRDATFTGRRIEVAGSHEVAVVAAAGATVTLEEILVEGTLGRSCGVDCEATGIGMGAYLGGHLLATRFQLSGNALVGAQVAVDGELDLHDGLVSDNPVGVNVQVPGYDVGRLMDEVRFSNNGVNLDSAELPVPAATAGL